MAVVSNRILVIGGSIDNMASDLIEMYNITNKTWSFCNLLPSPATDFALAKIFANDISNEAVEKHFKFKNDVVVERNRRIFNPLSEHFKWKI